MDIRIIPAGATSKRPLSFHQRCDEAAIRVAARERLREVCGRVGGYGDSVDCGAGRSQIERVGTDSLSIQHIEEHAGIDGAGRRVCADVMTAQGAWLSQACAAK